MKISGYVKHSPINHLWIPYNWQGGKNKIVDIGLDAFPKILASAQGITTTIKLGDTNTSIADGATSLPGSVITQSSSSYSRSYSTPEHSFTIQVIATITGYTGTTIYTSGLFIDNIMYAAKNYQDSGETPVLIDTSPFYYIVKWKTIMAR